MGNKLRAKGKGWSGIRENRKGTEMRKTPLCYSSEMGREQNRTELAYHLLKFQPC